jgi:hypothetical protein
MQRLADNEHVLSPALLTCRGGVFKMFKGELALEYPPADAEQLEKLITLQEKLRLTEMDGDVYISHNHDALSKTTATFLVSVINKRPLTIFQKQSIDQSERKPHEIRMWCHLSLIGYDDCKWWKLKRLFVFFADGKRAIFSRDKISWDFGTREIIQQRSHTPQSRVVDVN